MCVWLCKLVVHSCDSDQAIFEMIKTDEWKNLIQCLCITIFIYKYILHALGIDTLEQLQSASVPIW